MVTLEKIKAKRKEFGLSQEAMARAIYVEKSTYTRYENNERAINLDTLERIANVFGCTIDMNPIEEDRCKEKSNLYKEKSASEIIKMKDEDIVDYIFVNCDNSTIARICNQSEYMISLLDLKQVKQLITDAIEIKSKRVLFHILDNTYGSHEEILIPFVDEVNYYLETQSKISKEMIERAYYLEADWDYYDESYYKGWSFENLKLLDESGNDLNIMPIDIQDGEPLDDYFEDWLNNGIGLYLRKNNRLRLK